MAFPSIMLFSDPQQFRSEPSGFLVSMLVHGVATGCLYLGLQHTPKIDDRLLAQQYTVRVITVSRDEPQFHLKSPGSGYQHEHSPKEKGQAGGRKIAEAGVIRDAMYRVPAPQTLVQPDLPSDMTLREKAPVPSVVLWSPGDSAKRLIPRAAVNAATAEVAPSLALPNRESTIADWRMAATRFVTQAPTLPLGSSSPVAVHGPNLIRRAPETTSITTESPTPARVIALSELQVAQGIVVVPVANQLAAGSSAGLGVGQGKSATSGDTLSSSGSGPGKDGGAGSKLSGEGSADVVGSANGSPGSGRSQQGTQGTERGGFSNPGEQKLEPDRSVTHIALPKNGNFGVVVVGSSPVEEYPEVQAAWGGRLAYTVYLHVGSAKNWILQYSLPREAEAAAGGTMVRPDAPWPYAIERPNLEDSNADTIIIHGFVNVAGRLEQLSFVFPTDFPNPDFMLGALRRWQFRPAMQNGEPVLIEVLLIIPRKAE